MSRSSDWPIAQSVPDLRTDPGLFADKKEKSIQKENQGFTDPSEYSLYKLTKHNLLFVFCFC